MKLYIDTSSNKKTVVTLEGDRLEESSSVWHSQVVIPMIKKLLRKCKADIKNITEIEVVTGPGSYTGLRVGVSIANVLGFVLGIPVNNRKISGKEIVEPKYG